MVCMLNEISFTQFLFVIRQDSAISDSKNEIITKMLRNSNIQNDEIKTFQETYQKKLHLLAVINLSDMSQMLVEMILDVFWKGV